MGTTMGATNLLLIKTARNVKLTNIMRMDVDKFDHFNTHVFPLSFFRSMYLFILASIILSLRKLFVLLLIKNFDQEF